MCVRTRTVSAVYIILIGVSSATVPSWCKRLCLQAAASLSEAPLGKCSGWWVDRACVSRARKHSFACVDPLVLNHLKELKLKGSSLELGSKPVFNLCILLNDPSKTVWKQVDFESSQLSSLSNQTAPKVHRRGQAGKWPACLCENGFTRYFCNNKLLCRWGIKHFKVIYATSNLDLGKMMYLELVSVP